MQGHDLIEVQLSLFQSRVSRIHWQEMRRFGEIIHYDQNRVIPPWSIG